MWGWFEKWISEIMADFWSVARIGVGATLGLMAVLSLPRQFVFRLDLHDDAQFIVGRLEVILHPPVTVGPVRHGHAADSLGESTLEGTEPEVEKHDPVESILRIDLHRPHEVEQPIAVPLARAGCKDRSHRR